MTEGAASHARFRSYIDLWRLTPKCQPVLTRTSRLLLVRWWSVAAMHKIAVEAEEELCNELMVWWDRHRWCWHEKAKQSFWSTPRMQRPWLILRAMAVMIRQPVSTVGLLKGSTYPKASRSRVSSRFRK
jgi:hypothetical protein